MTDLLTGATFVALFDGVQRSARRLEVRDRYAADQPDLDRWLAGGFEELPDSQARRSWLGRLRRTTAAGATWERTRVVREPPTAAQRFLVMAGQQNVQAGEDIRYLTRDRANELDLPAHDCWLFDDESLAFLWFTADDRMLGAQVVTGQSVVSQHRLWLDRAFQAATPSAEFVAADPTRAERPD
jgi:hypothetical protein